MCGNTILNLQVESDDALLGKVCFAYDVLGKVCLCLSIKVYFHRDIFPLTFNPQSLTLVCVTHRVGKY